jgi:hypothetical protein
MYSLEREESLEKQVEECAEHMFLKHGTYPNLAYINPKNMGDDERNYKTSKGKHIKFVPDEREMLRSFTLAVGKA